jgi:hypothetical protein
MGSIPGILAAAGLLAESFGQLVLAWSPEGITGRLVRYLSSELPVAEWLLEIAVRRSRCGI